MQVKRAFMMTLEFRTLSSLQSVNSFFLHQDVAQSLIDLVYYMNGIVLDRNPHQ